jgi:hypothetical protein
VIDDELGDGGLAFQKPSSLGTLILAVTFEQQVYLRGAHHRSRRSLGKD